MKAVNLVLIAVLVLAINACSTSEQKVETDTQEETSIVTQGEPITLAEVTSLETMMAAPGDYLDQVVLIQGQVIGRCSDRGCWISLDRGENAEGLIVRAEDESFIFPEECVGRKVAVQGMLKVRDLHAEAEQKDEHAAEEADHVCPNPEYFFAPQGIRIGA